MKTVEIGIYTFDELSEDAKERARDWYRESDEFNPEFEQFETLLGRPLIVSERASESRSFCN